MTNLNNVLNVYTSHSQTFMCLQNLMMKARWYSLDMPKSMPGAISSLGDACWCSKISLATYCALHTQFKNAPLSSCLSQQWELHFLSPGAKCSNTPGHCDTGPSSRGDHHDDGPTPAEVKQNGTYIMIIWLGWEVARSYTYIQDSIVITGCEEVVIASKSRKLKVGRKTVS
jgi:hypothetical protein